MFTFWAKIVVSLLRVQYNRAQVTGKNKQNDRICTPAADTIYSCVHVQICAHSVYRFFFSLKFAARGAVHFDYYYRRATRRPWPSFGNDTLCQLLQTAKCTQTPRCQYDSNNTIDNNNNNVY